MKINIIFFLFAIYCFSKVASGQQTTNEQISGQQPFLMQSLNASGGEAFGANGTTTYSVGQLFFTTISSSNTIVIQGVQQAHESIGIEIRNMINVLAYPNPMIDYLILTVDHFENRRLEYQFFDIQGKLLIKENIKNQETRITPPLLKKGFYILSIIEGKRLLKSIKIIKN